MLSLYCVFKDPFPSIHLKNPPGFQDVFQLSLSFLREAGFVHVHFLEGLG